MTDLGALASGASSFAFDINDLGDVVGFSATGQLYNGKEVTHATLWSNAQITDLGTLGGRYSRATAVNDSRCIVGASLIDDGPMHAFVWRGSMVDLGTLGGASSEAWDVDDLGRIVGVADDNDGNRRAFLVADGPMQDLGALPGARASEAFGINDAGHIVGSSWIEGVGPHAVLWIAGSSNELDASHWIDLNDSIEPGSAWTLQVARAINESGQIVGYGRIRERTRAFLLTPTTH
jgi:probable HAF family extracellular repeat protein